MKDVSAVVLAAGKGTRMKSDLAKVLHLLDGRPLLLHVLDRLHEIDVGQIVVVIGHQAEAVAALCDRPNTETVLQAEQLGTGHAVKQAQALLQEHEGLSLVLCGDVPLLRAETLRALVEHTRLLGAAATVLSAEAHDATGYGRIIRGPNGQVLGIVEEKDASELQRRIREYNTGTYCFDSALLWPALARLDQENSQGEFYLTDVIEILVRDGHRVEGLRCKDEREVQGINTIEDLQRAESDLRDLRR